MRDASKFQLIETSRRLKIAAIQMDAAPAPVDERLERASRLLERAAADGAVLQRVTETGDALAVSEVELPRPRQKQPAFGISPLAYFADWLANRLLDG